MMKEKMLSSWSCMVLEEIIWKGKKAKRVSRTCILAQLEGTGEGVNQVFIMAAMSRYIEAAYI